MSVVSRTISADSDVPYKTPRKSERPVFWIVAGPNGCGKSSLYNRTDIEGWGGSVWIINPDLLTATILESECVPVDQANLAAVQRIECWLEASLNTYQTIGVETVLSSSKYRRLVSLAQKRGFEVRMIYVVLDSMEEQLERIRIRVANGGHDVPVTKVAERRQRSFDQLAWFVMHVDRCFVFNNSAGGPALIAEKLSGSLSLVEDLPTDLHATLTDAGVPLISAAVDLD